ncbi:hypothetical protein T484DRAFT_1848734, partial [Baffinella frigidus]
VLRYTANCHDAALTTCVVRYTANCHDAVLRYTANCHDAVLTTLTLLVMNSTFDEDSNP